MIEAILLLLFLASLPGAIGWLLGGEEDVTHKIFGPRFRNPR